MPEDMERRGIGTPATRAAILEKLVDTGLVERKKAKKITSLLPTQAGSSLVTVLVFPQDKAALPIFTEKALFALNNSTAAAETNYKLVFDNG